MIRWLLLLPVACLAGNSEMVQLAVQADGLYWKPTTGGLDLSLRAGHVDMVKPDGHWGVRGGVSVLAPWSCTSLTVGGLYIQTSDSHRVVGDITATAFDVEVGDELTGLLQFKYWNVDALTDYTPFPNPCFNLAIVGGLRLAEISQRQTVRALNSARVKLRYRGIGPGVGVRGSWSVWQGLQLTAHLYTMSLIGPRATSLRVGEARTHYPDATTVIPAADLSLAINYSLDWGGFLATFSIGYDLHHYWRAFNRIAPFGVETWRRTPQGAGFAGPSVRVGMRW